MRDWFVGAAMAGAALICAPAIAATHLECIDNGYTPEQEAVFENYLSAFTVASIGNDQDTSSDALVAPISSRAADCTLQHGWSGDAVYSAIVYRMAVMLAAALDVKTPLTAEQMDGLEAAFAKADQAKLRAILGPGIEASLKGQEGPAVSEADEFYLGMIVISAGLPMEQTYSEYAGAVLGARMMAEMAAEKFAVD